MSLSLSHLRLPGRVALCRPTVRLGLVTTSILALSTAASGVARAQSLPFPTGPSVGCPSTASAATAPFLRIFVNGACTDLSSLITPTAPGMWTIADQTVTLSDATVTLTSVTFKAEPFITFQAGTTNLTPGPTTYAFLFGTPVTPGLYTSASSSGYGSIAPGAAQNTTVSPDSLYPAMVGAYGTDGPDATNLNVNVGTAPCTVTGTTTGPCDLGTNSSAFSPTYFDNLEAVLTYKQNDLQSSAAFSGRVDLNLASATTVTPEPGTLSLLATGLVGLAGVLRRKGRRGS